MFYSIFVENKQACTKGSQDSLCLGTQLLFIYMIICNTILNTCIKYVRKIKI